MTPPIRRIAIVPTIAGPVGMLLYSYIYFSETSLIPSLQNNIPGLIWSFCVAAIIGCVLHYANRKLDQLLPWRSGYLGRYLVGFTSNFLIALGICFGLMAVFNHYSEPSILWGGQISGVDMKWKISILLLATIFIYNIIYSLLYSYQQYAVAQLETLHRERKQLELQFETLKSQLSPHYLFNSLNTISSLLYKDVLSAEQFVRRLAQTYQYILSTQQKKFVTLKEEVEFVQSYYYLLRIRFQQQLQVEINLPSNLMSSRIPPLTLQILVENAVKHNSINSDNKLFIYITAPDNTFVRVINTKNSSMENISSFHVGLENIKKRYAFFTDRKVEITDDDQFTVSLPVIRPQDQSPEQKHYA